MTFWTTPWRYKQSLLILVSVVINGLVIEFIRGGEPLNAPPFPGNLLSIAAIVVVATLIFFLRPLSFFKNWLSSKYFAITAITTLGLFVMISGYIPQGTKGPLLLKKLGLLSITQGIPYLLLILLISCSLIIVTIKQFAWSFKKLAFSLNHLGLLIILLGGTLGAGDLHKVRMDIYSGKVEWQGYMPASTHKFDMPFALKMSRFVIEEFPPKLVFINNQNKILSQCGAVANAKTLCSYKGYEVNPVNFIPDGFKVKNRYVAVKHAGTAPVAEVQVMQKGKVVAAGFITPGSFVQPPEVLKINNNLFLASPVPKVKAFQSIGTYFTPDGKSGPFSIAVNKPFKIDGWELYQFGYDDKKGKWSDLSIIEAVKDPWLPVVYGGIFMLMFGTILLVFTMKRKND